MTFLRRLIARLRRRSLRPLPELTEALLRKEQIFKAPPLTSDLLATIRRISPQLRLNGDEASRRYWEAEQNGCCWGEYEALGPILETMPPPRKILEIGPGLGRSVVFFTKKLGWRDAVFDLYEGTGDQPRYTLQGPRSNDSFCGNIDVLKEVLRYNQIEAVRVFNAPDLGFDLRKVPGPYDLIYSFYAVGFHWSLAAYWDEVQSLMHARSLAVFTVPDSFVPFDALCLVSHRLLRYPTVYPANRHLNLLVVGEAAPGR